MNPGSDYMVKQYCLLVQIISYALTLFPTAPHLWTANCIRWKLRRHHLDVVWVPLPLLTNVSNHSFRRLLHKSLQWTTGAIIGSLGQFDGRAILIHCYGDRVLKRHQVFLRKHSLRWLVRVVDKARYYRWPWWWQQARKACALLSRQRHPMDENH